MVDYNPDYVNFIQISRAEMDSEETAVIENRLQDESPTEEMVSFTLKDDQLTSMNIEYACLFTSNVIRTQLERTRPTPMFAIFILCNEFGKERRHRCETASSGDQVGRQVRAKERVDA